MPEKITAWSYSRKNDYDTCPAKAKFKHVDKLKEPGNEAMERGSRIHKLAEDYVKGLIRTVPKELKMLADEFKALKKSPGVEAESELTLRKDWSITGWFEKDAWLRVKIDACYMHEGIGAVIIDHKTGKEKDYSQQMELYAIAAFLKYPNATKAQCQIWFIDAGKRIVSIFDRSDLPALKKKWEKATKAMLSDTRFAPSPVITVAGATSGKRTVGHASSRKRHRGAGEGLVAELRAFML